MNLITKTKTTVFITGLLSCCNAAAIEMAQDYKCPAIPLLKDAPLELRKRSTNSVDDPFYLSTQFCFGLSGPKLPLPKNLQVSKYSKAQIFELQINYNRVYDNIENQQQKLNFVHLFLRELTHRAVVLPSSFGEPRAAIIIHYYHKHHRFVSFAMKITPDMGHQAALHKLRALQHNPPKSEDHPELMKLIELVLDVSRRLPYEEIYPLTNAI